MTPADLTAAREALGLSQAAMAQRLGIPRNTWHRWERGTMRIERPEVLRLALLGLQLENSSPEPLDSNVT